MTKEELLEKYNIPTFASIDVSDYKHLMLVKGGQWIFALNILEHDGLGENNGYTINSQWYLRNRNAAYNNISLHQEVPFRYVFDNCKSIIREELIYHFDLFLE